MMHHVTQYVLGIFSRGLLKITFLNKLLDAQVLPLGPFKFAKVSAVAGWGRRRSTIISRNYAALLSLNFIALEDGFLRSFGIGKHHPPLSIVVDDIGIYYDCTRPSALEQLLSSDLDLLAGNNIQIQQAKALIQKNKLSKYNHAPLLDEAIICNKGAERILIIDQTKGDMSVALGGATADTFIAMLAAARAENPKASIYIKTHPEVSFGTKRGYLTHIKDDERTFVLRNAINPLSLIEKMDKVYVVSSGMGFETLLVGKPVAVFGMPWYAGWGVTDDRQVCTRRNRTRSVDELFAAAYFHYTRYLNPVTHERGEIFDVIDWLINQKKMSLKYSGKMICVGFPRQRATCIKPVLSLNQKNVVFVANVEAAEALTLQSEDCLIHWGACVPEVLAHLAKKYSMRLLRMQDGLICSAGHGTDRLRPLSLVLDEQGIYFDATRASGLETILSRAQFSSEELSRAQNIREFIVLNGISKYGIESREPTSWNSKQKSIILVLGQIDDESIKLGASHIKNNLNLLQQVREASPSAFIVYKPPSEGMRNTRTDKLEVNQALNWADYVEQNLSTLSCIEASSEIHTITSPSGFDALLRGKKVVVYGQPFYAGWGLTEDVCLDEAVSIRRKRHLTLNELVAASLLRYPIYWDWDLNGYTTCEAVLNKISS
jgi:capsular polysaccharide export protein